MAATLSTISFDDVTLGASVRFTTIEAKQYLSVRDLIMCLCEMDNNDAGHTWRRLSAELKQGINEFLATFQFPGRGQSSQPVITFPGTIPLNFQRGFRILRKLPISRAWSVCSAHNHLSRYHLSAFCG